MQTLSDCPTTSTQWAVFTGMRRVLLSAGAQCLPEQAARGRDAGGDRAIPREPWPGASVGVRAPRAGETPLSWGEVWHGVREGVL